MKSGLLRFVTFAFLMLASIGLCLGQQDDTQGIGLVQYGSYHGGDIDSVDLKSGNLFAKIPLFSLPQLGDLSLSMSMEINNSGYAMDSFCEWVVIDDMSDMEDACYPYVYRTTMFGPSLTLDQSFSMVLGGGTFGYYGYGDCCEDSYETFSMVDATGASHTMAQDVSNTNIVRAIDGSGYSFIGTNGSGTVTTPTGIQVALDNFSQLIGNTNGNEVASIHDVHGNSILVGSSGDQTALPQGFQAQVLSCCGQGISDPGIGENQAQLPLPFTATVIDSIGRVIPDFYSATFASDSNSLSVCPNLGVSNQQPALVQTWVVPGPYDPNLPAGQQYQSTYKFCYASITVNTNLLGGWQSALSDDGTGVPDTNYYADLAESAYVIQSIILPNGTHWGFVYDSAGPASEYSYDPLGGNYYADEIPPGHYGDVTKIIYPTGGSVSYGYYNSPTNSQQPPQGLIYCRDSDSWFGRAVSSRTVSLSSTDQNPRTWTYKMTSTPGLVPSNNGIYGMVTTVVDPVPSQGENQSQTVHVFQHPASWPLSLYTSGATCILPEEETDYEEIQPSSNTPTILRKVISNYNYSTVYPNGPAGIYSQAPMYVTALQSATVEEGAGSSTTSYVYPNLFSTAQYYWDIFRGTMQQSPQTQVSIPFSQPSKITVTGSDGSNKMTSVSYQWQGSTQFYNANVLSSIASSCTSSLNVNAGACTLALSGSGSGTQYTYGDSSSPFDVASVQQILNGNWVTTKSMNSDSHGRVISTSDAYGNPTSVLAFGADPVTGSTTPFPTQIQRPLLPIEYFSYDDNSGNLLSYKDVNGNTTTYTYGDPEGRLTSVLYPDGGGTTYCYTDVGGSTCSQSSPPYSLVATTTATPDPNIVTTTLYDGLGRVVQNQLNPNSAGTVYTDTTYDALGRSACVSNPHYAGSSSGQICTTYDGLSRKVVQSLPDSSTMQWCYNGLQTDGQSNCQASSLSSIATVNWVDATDEVGHHTQQSSDGLGNLVAVMEQAPAGTSLSLETDYGYDVLGNLLTVNQRGNVGMGDTPRTRSFTYDQMSRLLLSSNPESGQVCYGLWSGGSPGSGTCQDYYDLNGNLHYKTDARGITTTYTYDTLNRITQKTYSDGTPGSYFTYNTWTAWGTPPTNAIGRLAYETNNLNDAKIFSYDAMGRATRVEGCLPDECGVTSHVTMAGYDLAGQLKTLTYPDGRQVGQSWDQAGRLSSVSGGTTTSYWTANSYFPDGSPNSVSYGNGATELRSENSRLQTCELSVFMPPAIGGTQVSDHQYFFAQGAGGTPCAPTSGNNGNIWQIVDNTNPMVGSNVRNQTFGYDNLNRLTSWSTSSMSGSSRGQTYSYDSFGNIQQSNGVNMPNFSPGYDPYNHMQNLSCGSQTYDLSGNLRCQGMWGVDAQTYLYDAESRVSQVQAQSMGTQFNILAQYTYDTEGNRIRKDIAPLNNQNYTEYVDFGGQPIAEKDQSGNWTDYIYANGRKVAKVSSGTNVIHIGGTFSGYASAWFYQSLSGITIANGDHLIWQQRNSPGACGGLNMNFTTGNLGYNAWDSYGYAIEDGSQNGWHSRSFDLSGFQGQQATGWQLDTNEYCTQAGAWNLYFADVVIVHADGSVTPLYNQGSGIGLASTPSNDVNYGNISNLVVETVPPPADGTGNAVTHYYIADHLGTTSMEFSSGGWPVWRGDYAPFGQELLPGTATDFVGPLPADGTSMHYKFTGKERDTESGLDYFGARYYASSMGRFSSPDPAGPWVADVSDPQSWNMYAYARNNPLINVDLFGYDCVYLNDAGNAAEEVDTHSNSGECGDHGGYWVDGTFTSGTVYANNNDVYLHGYDSSTGQLTDSYTNVFTANGNSPINTDVFSGQNLFAYLPNQALPADVLNSMIHSLNRSGQSDKLVGCIISTESRGFPGSSNKGSTARGLMQVLKGGATDVANHATDGSFGGMNGKQLYSQANDPAINIATGTALLKLKVGYAKGNVQNGLDMYGTGSPYGKNRLGCASKP